MKWTNSWIQDTNPTAANGILSVEKKEYVTCFVTPLPDIQTW